MNGVLVLSNVEPDDITFDSDRGSWNITRAVEDCKAKKHKMWGFNVDDLYQAIQNVEVSQEKIDHLAANRKKLLEAPPVILIIEDGRVWVIDGHHRIHACKRAGLSRISGYVIEEKDSARYIIWYNGQRLAPWLSKK
jgi:ParB-like nuclease domain